MHLKRLLKIIDNILPPETAMRGDRTGLQIQSGRDEINRILVALEMNEEVIKEAELKNINCIIVFHPLIYNPLTQIINSDRIGNLVTEIIKRSISLISVHTTFDTYPEGTSKLLADRLGLDIERVIIPDKQYEGRGMGILCKGPVSRAELLQRVSDTCSSPVRYSDGAKEELESIAIIGGSGTSFFDDVKESGADCFITADISYHTFHAANGEIMLIDPGHYEMEQFVPEALAVLIRGELKSEDIEIYRSEIHTNPVKYFPQNNVYLINQKNYLLNKRMDIDNG